MHSCLVVIRANLGKELLTNLCQTRVWTRKESNLGFVEVAYVKHNCWMIFVCERLILTKVFSNLIKTSIMRCVLLHPCCLAADFWLLEAYLA